MSQHTECPSWAPTPWLCYTGSIFLPVWAQHNGNLPSQFYGTNDFLPRILTQTNYQDWLHFQTDNCSVTISTTHNISGLLGDRPHQMREKLRETEIRGSENWESKRREAKGLPEWVRVIEVGDTGMKEEEGSQDRCLPEKGTMVDRLMPFACWEEIHTSHRV